MKRPVRATAPVQLGCGALFFLAFVVLAAAPSTPWVNAVAVYGAWLLSVLVAFFFTRAEPTDDEPPG